jgi:hypothetical protein
MTRLRLALVALLAASTLLFGVGVLAERANSDEPAAVTRTAGEHTESEEGEGVEGHVEAGHGSESHEVSERLAGVDLESTPLLVLAVIGGLALAGLAASGLGRRRAFLFSVVAVALVWAALDVREVAHLFDESSTGIAIVATVVAVLHVSAAAVAGRLAARARVTASSA